MAQFEQPRDTRGRYTHGPAPAPAASSARPIGQKATDAPAKDTPAIRARKKYEALHRKHPELPETLADHEQVVHARYGPFVVSGEGITEETRWVYHSGQCFALAIVLAEETGTDVGLLVRDNDTPWGTNYRDPDHMLDLDHDWIRDTVHAVALLDDGATDDDLAMDIDGSRDLAAIREEHVNMHAGTLIRIHPQDLRPLLRGGWIFEQNYEAAALVVPHIAR